MTRWIWGIFCSNMDISQYHLSAQLPFLACKHNVRSAETIAFNTHVGVDFHAGLGYPRERMMAIPNGFDTEAYHDQKLNFAR